MEQMKFVRRVRKCKYILVGGAEHRHRFRLKAINMYLKETESVDWSQVAQDSVQW
jgi:hypothetical protein